MSQLVSILRQRWVWIVGLILVLGFVAANLRSEPPGYVVVLDGLDEPRGLSVLSDGRLCVAEAGRLAEGQKVEEGPTANRAPTGAVSCVDTQGVRQRIVEQLPYVFYNVTGVSAGPADIAELDGELYLLTGEGEGTYARTLLKITDPTGPPEVVADFLEFAVATAEPNFFDEIDIFSNPYAMMADPTNDGFLVTDGATGFVLAAGIDGDIEVFSTVEGHEVLTGIAFGPGAVPYVTSFSQLPHDTGDGSVLRLASDGSFSVVADGLTTPIDLAFDSEGRMYVLEFIDGTTTDHPYIGKVGRLLRLERDGDRWTAPVVLVERLPFPTAVLINQNSIYISVNGAFRGPGTGLVVRFDDLLSQPSNDPTIRFVDPSS